MGNMDKIDRSSSIILNAAGISDDDPLFETLIQRADLFGLSEHAHNACLTPRDPGGINYSERAALAARMCLLHGESVLADHYESMLPAGHVLFTVVKCLVDATIDARLQVLVRHVDLVTTHPKDATSSDIDHLKVAGIIDADIVRLSELIAFVNYQIRVVQGIRIMRDLT